MVKRERKELTNKFLDGWRAHNLKQQMQGEPFPAGMVCLFETFYLSHFAFFDFFLPSCPYKYLLHHIEPAVKAIFEITLTVPADRTALSSIQQNNRQIKRISIFDTI